MNFKMVLWLGAVVILCIGLALLTPERIGDRSWSVIKVPLVVLLAASWFGLVLAVIAQVMQPNRSVAPEPPDIDLSAAAPADETLIASARRVTKLTVLLLGLICAALAVWDGLMRTPPQLLRTGIWASAAGALVAYLYKLMRCGAVFTPSGISGHEYGRAIAKTYADVADFRVLPGSGIQILFSDGQKLTVTSDMADLKKVLATVTVRRLS